jgi:hypothetical protein
MEPVLCPVCTRPTLGRLLEPVSVSAKIDHEDHILMVYRCTEYNHIFLVRRDDVKASFQAPLNVKATPKQATQPVNVRCPICRATGFDENGNFCMTCAGTGELAPLAQISLLCPLCTRASIERLPDNFKISPKWTATAIRLAAFSPIAAPNMTTLSSFG